MINYFQSTKLYEKSCNQVNDNTTLKFENIYNINQENIINKVNKS